MLLLMPTLPFRGMTIEFYSRGRNLPPVLGASTTHHTLHAIATIILIRPQAAALKFNSETPSL